MKVVLPLVVLVIFAQSLQAQWISVTPAGFDRGRPSHSRHIRSLSLPEELPNWPFPNVNVTRSPDHDQTEPSIAIDPLDPNTIIAGANDDRTAISLWAYTSHDGGLTWSNRELPVGPSWVTLATDPSLAFRSDGTAYYLCGHLADPALENDVALYFSSDRGDSWRLASYPFINANGATSDTSSDKFFLGVDNLKASPYHDRIYATWVETAFPDKPRIVSSFSTDSGKTWSKRIFLTQKAYYSSPIPAVSPDGALAIAYVNYDIDSNLIYSVASTDGGRAFRAPSLISTYRNLGPWRGDTLNMNGFPVIKDTIGVNSFPSIAFSPIAPFDLFAVWCAKDASGVSHLFLSTSTNNGDVWSPPRVIDGDTSSRSTDKFFPWIAIDSISGNIAVDFYDSRLDTNNVMTDLWMAHSTNRGQTFQVRRISNASFDPRITDDERVAGDQHIQFFGDYIGLAGHSNTWHPVWTDARIPGDLDIFTATVQPFAPMPVSDLQLHDTTINGHSVSAISWRYSGESTFGYPLMPPYSFIVQRGSVFDTLPYTARIDTSADSTITYKIWVRANGYNSIIDSISRSKSGVAVISQPESVTVSLSRQPAIQGKSETISVTSQNPCSISIQFFDELGREVEHIEDAVLTSAHSVRFTPDISGVTYYTIRGMSISGAWQRTGRLLTLPGE